VIPLEDERPRGAVVREPVAVLGHHGRVAARVVNVLEVGAVVAGPVGLKKEDKINLSAIIN
jgi:hypothetical protein